MSTLIGHIGTGTALQSNATATGNGTAVDISGAVRALVAVRDHTATAFTAGAFVLETSSDGGSNWASATAYAVGQGDAGTAETFPKALPTSGNPDLWYFLPHLDGPTQIRCRISTTVTGSAIDATVYPIGL